MGIGCDPPPDPRPIVVSRPAFSVPLPGGRALHLGERTLVMGVLNVTPDSFADGGRWIDPGQAADAALSMEQAGADIIDIGGESTRPGAEAVPAGEELARLLPVLERLEGRLRIPMSIDTYKAVVAREALDRGAALVNDISALEYDPALADVVALRGAALVLMHNRGRSRQMYREATYDDVVLDVRHDLQARIDGAVASGIPRERLIIDPGVGFAKRAAQSLAVIARLPELATLDRPLLVGPSRKSFLQEAIGERGPERRDWATAAAVTAAVMLGAHIVRVHAVSEMVDVVRAADALRRAGER